MLPFVGSAKTAIHNWIFLENVKTAITSDPEWLNGEYKQPLTLAFRRMRLVFDSWGLSGDFYRQKLHLTQGFATTSEYLKRSAPGQLCRLCNLYLRVNPLKERLHISARERLVKIGNYLRVSFRHLFFSQIEISAELVIG